MDLPARSARRTRHLRVPCALVAVASFAGCWASETQLRTRAAADFDCAPEQLTVSDGQGDARRVRGCGHDESYIFNSEAKAWLPAADANARVITRQR